MTTRLLRRAEVLSITGMSASSLQRAMRCAGFPYPVRLSAEPTTRAVGWPSPAVDAWVKARIAAGPKAG